MTEALTLSTAFILGLLGGTHCLGMCGGIASSVAMASPNGARGILLLLGYNTGRIFSYALAGAILGSFGSFIQDPTLLVLLRSGAAIMLILMGLYIAQWWKVLTQLEQAGSIIWRKISPFACKLLPVTNLTQAMLLGLIWGWLPCGLVYSTLLWSASAADWQTSAQLMLMFGLGTLPVLLLTGLLAQQLKQLIQQRITQQLAGSIIIAMGLYTLPWHGLAQAFKP